jgi:hypothetical protein
MLRRIEIIFAAFIDNPQIAILLCILVRNHSIKLVEIEAIGYSDLSTQIAKRAFTHLIVFIVLVQFSAVHPSAAALMSPLLVRLAHNPEIGNRPITLVSQRPGEFLGVPVAVSLRSTCGA